MGHAFVGIGFGAIQGGLFLREAHRSGKFDRLVVAEVLPEVVGAVRQQGSFSLNIATSSGIKHEIIEGIEILNPTDTEDYPRLVAAIAEASAMATALPSVDFYDRGNPSVASVLSEGLKTRATRDKPAPCVVYAAENHNHAAECLARAVYQRVDDETASILKTTIHFANTVIGKMSQVLADGERINALGLARIAPGLDRAFLVEAFNRILVTKTELEPAPVGIDVFIEKADLLPFEEAKLYGHNATHALVGYIAHRKGYETMSEALADSDLKEFARGAFLYESGAPIIARYAGLDPLFTPRGYMDYVDDLIERMANSYLEDRVARIIRDPRRKLGWDDRLIGTMRLALQANVEPARFAVGAAEALRLMDPSVSSASAGELLRGLWQHAEPSAAETDAVIDRVGKAL